MKAEALTSFAGMKYSAIPGEVIDICEEEIYKDLLNAGYIKPAEDKKIEEKTGAKPKATTKKKATK